LGWTPTRETSAKKQPTRRHAHRTRRRPSRNSQQLRPGPAHHRAARPGPTSAARDRTPKSHVAQAIASERYTPCSPADRHLDCRPRKIPRARIRTRPDQRNASLTSDGYRKTITGRAYATCSCHAASTDWASGDVSTVCTAHPETSTHVTPSPWQPHCRIGSSPTSATLRRLLRQQLLDLRVQRVRRPVLMDPRRLRH